MQPLLRRFIDSFEKAITAEMDAMRRQLGPFEVALAGGKALDSAEEDGYRLYTFDIRTPSDKLALQMECTLRSASRAEHGGEWLVTITAIGQSDITLRCEQEIHLGDSTYTLVIYPWFLYERLKLALQSLADSPDHYVANALMLFGKGLPHRQAQPLQAEHGELNASQRQAAQLCSDSNLAFVWGPPGTGKTTTLGHIVTELLSQGQRVLITSTTNAAVDHALAKLAALPEAQPPLARGEVIRIGQASAETFGAGLAEVVARLDEQGTERLRRLRARRLEAQRQAERCRRILAELQAASQPLQLDLFQVAQPEVVSAQDLATVFSTPAVRSILALPPRQQEARVARRLERLEAVGALCREGIARHARERGSRELAAVKRARVVLATMTNVYMSQLLQGESFDAVIVEEAGMAILPTLFYCATLARSKVIMVGDPKQLPPIVQSRDEYVQRAMGRNIFEVAAPGPRTGEMTVMLDVQYRMHPAIGDLVSDLFYSGRLRHGENTAERGDIAGRKPFAGRPLVLVDTRGQTTCATQDGSYSRYNERTAQLCLDLALEAIHDGIESVAIITPYVAQSRLIRRLLAGLPNSGEAIECQTVHRFQGGERDMVILDTVDAAPLSPGVLLAGQSPHSSSENLVNVSISRARGKLVIVADVAYFGRHAAQSIVSEMLRRAEQAGARVLLA